MIENYTHIKYRQWIVGYQIKHSGLTCCTHVVHDKLILLHKNMKVNLTEKYCFKYISGRNSIYYLLKPNGNGNFWKSKQGIFYLKNNTTIVSIIFQSKSKNKCILLM